jgi:hypothetical protein
MEVGTRRAVKTNMTNLADIAREQVAYDAHEINDIVLTMLNEYRLSKSVRERLRAVLDNSQRIARNADGDAGYAASRPTAASHPTSKPAGDFAALADQIAGRDGESQHDVLNEIMTALAHGVVNITCGHTTIEDGSRVHKAMSAIVEMHVAGKLHATRHSFERKAVRS